MRFSGAYPIVVSAVAALAVLAPHQATAAPPPSHAATVTVSAATLPSAPACRDPLARLKLFRDSSGFSFPSSLRIIDETRKIDLSRFLIAEKPFADPSRKLWYESLLWLAWAAAVAKDEGRSTDVKLATDAALRALAAAPDPGSATPEALAASNRDGWGAGSAFRRLEALNCLADVVGTAPLAKYLHSHARVLLDDKRYFGPPLRRVTNLGMLSNLLLIDVGKRLGYRPYRDGGINRLLREQKSVFTTLGSTFEGSSHYHKVLMVGWSEVAGEFEKRGLGTQAQQIRIAVNRASDVAAHYIGPSGSALLIGNSRPADGYARPPANGRPLLINDTEGGFASGRWSWTSRVTSHWTALNRSRIGSHGHADSTSVTWQTRLLPILVDPGQPDYQKSNPFTAWSKTREAHNLSIPTKQRRDRDHVRSTEVQRLGKLDQITMITSASGRPQTREVLVDHRRRMLLVSDHVRGGQTQRWHLDPRWTVDRVSGAQATLSDSAGHQLVIESTKGTMITARAGATAPMIGWQTTGFESLVPAAEIGISGSNRLDTRFTLDPDDEDSSKSPLLVKNQIKGDKSVTLQIRSTNDKSIRGYRVQMVTARSPWRTVVVQSGSREPSIPVLGLENGQRYRFRVASLTKTGMSRYSKTVTLVPRTIPGRVGGPRASVTKRGKIKLSWARPFSDGGNEVTGYVVLVKGIRPWAATTRPKVKFRASQRRRFVVKIRAVNDAGEGRLLKVKLRYRPKAAEVKIL